MIRGRTDLKCPYCGFTIRIFIRENITDEELKVIKECPCGKQMEDEQEIKARMERRKIKKKSFYVMISSKKDGEERIFALKKDGVEFERCGITLYAYQRGDFQHIFKPYCHVIDPETGLSICTADCPLDFVTRHISRNAIKFLLDLRKNKRAEYEERKKEFMAAERIETLDGEE